LKITEPICNAREGICVMKDRRDLSIYQRLKLRRVINAAGKMTALGGAALDPEVAQAMAAAGSDYVDMAELMRLAGEKIAEATGAQAGFITSCAAAGIALATAACITRGDLGRVEALPHPPGPPNRMVIQRGHAIHFGASILQMMAMAGAQIVEIGNANRTFLHQYAAVLDEQTAGVLFVVSHHTTQTEILPLASVIELAHAREIPVVVDVAAELDLRKYIAAGADLVIYSSQKGIEGPSAGLVAGRENWVAACAQQNAGIGRTMKIGKEAIVGTLIALDRFQRRDLKAEAAAQSQTAISMAQALSGIPGLQATVGSDPQRPIPRLQIALDANQARLSSAELLKRLQTQTPDIRAREHNPQLGTFEIDFRTLRPGEAEEIIASIRKYLSPP
jgi:D-glucosaminate-6-phosphate ammonia-lyase